MCDKTENANLNVSTEKFLDICRSCLMEVYKDYFWLEGFYNGVKVFELYRNVTTVQIDTEDNLPKKICTACYNLIIRFDCFKTKALQSEKLLTEINDGNDTKSEIDLDNYFTNNIWDDNDTCDESVDQDTSIDIIKIDVETDKLTDNETENINTFESLDKEHSETYLIEDQKENIVTKDTKEPSIENNKPKLKKKLLTQQRKSKKNVSQSSNTKKNLSEKKKQARRKEPCKECGKEFFVSKMANHMRCHTHERPFACEKCGASFTEKSNLNRHLKIHIGFKPFKCNACEKCFFRPSSLQIHQQTTHIPDKNVMCSHCGKAFKHQYFLNKHVRNIHNKTEEKVQVNGPSFPCAVCGNSYRTKSSLKVHFMKHQFPKSYLCNICGNTYSTKATLLNHQSVHTGEKKYSCAICEKSFKFQSTLKTHVLVHSGEKPLSCHICNKQFRQHSHLNTHIKGQHSSARPYKCSYCDKTFKQSCNLTVHTRIHTGETPYICDICRKGFYDSSSMKKHKKSHFARNSVQDNWKDQCE